MNWKQLKQLSRRRAARANASASEADARAKEAALQLEKFKEPRLLTQAEQNALTQRLSGLTKQRGTIVASPSTAESEWFARVLVAPLRAAGWDMVPVPGTATATVCGQLAWSSSMPLILSVKSKNNSTPE